MARGENSNEQSTEVESSVTPSQDESENNDSTDKDSGVRIDKEGRMGGRVEWFA